MRGVGPTPAAIEAGASPHGAKFTASRWLADSTIQAELKRRQQARAKRVRIDEDRVLRELACVALSDIGEILDFSGETPRLRAAKDIPVRARRAIASLKVKRHLEGTGDDARAVEVLEFRLHDKGGALEKAMRHLGMFVKDQEAAAPRQVIFNLVQEGQRYDRVAAAEEVDADVG